MKPVVIIDAAVVAGRDRFMEPGAISALLRLKSHYDLAVVDSDGLASWQEIETLLEGEGIHIVRFEAETFAGRSGVRLTSAVSGRRGTELEEVAEPMDPREIGWREVARRLMYPSRKASVDRATSETSIAVTVNLDGSGTADIRTGLGFFDHMLEQIARHSGSDISVSVSGDLHVDEHHTIEDTAIALGEAFGQAIGDKRGIERYSFVLPMDDSLARVAFDWSGRSWLVWDAEFAREKVGDMPTEMFYHFFKSFADSARCNLNIHVEGDNEHHKIESVFKAFGRCLGQASRRREDDDRVPSTKGIL